MYNNLPINKSLFEYLRKLSYEKVYCFNGNQFVFQKNSGMNPDKINFSIREKYQIRHDVDCIIHNHCNNSSLSINDFLLAVLNNVKTVIAISQDYLWRLDFTLPFQD